MTFGLLRKRSYLVSSIKLSASASWLTSVLALGGKPTRGYFFFGSSMPGPELDGNLARDILLFSPKATILFFQRKNS
jgi:hypothetical protein